MGARRVELPTYAFQRQRFWAEPALPVAPAAEDGADTDFWSAVEREDTDSLAATLDLDAEAVSVLAPALSSWRRRRRDRSTVDALRYQAIWKPTSATPRPQALPGRWLVLTPAGSGDDTWLTAVIDGLGAPTVRVEVTGADRGSLAERLPKGEFAGVLSLLALDDDDVFDGGGVSARTATAFQALGDAGIDAPLWCVTRGAVSVGRSEPVHSPAQAAVWGLGRVVALEHPRRWGGLIDLPERIDPATARRLRSVLADTGTDAEDQVAVKTAPWPRYLLSGTGGSDLPAKTTWPLAGHRGDQVAQPSRPAGLPGQQVDVVDHEAGFGSHALPDGIGDSGRLDDDRRDVRPRRSVGVDRAKAVATTCAR